MKNQPLILIVFLCFCSMALFLGCGKDDPKPTCRISTVTTNTGTVTNIVYLPNGKVSTITKGDLVSTYTYQGNNYEVVSFYAGTFVYRDSVTVNANGLAVNVRSYYNPAEDWTNYEFEYSGTELNQIRSTHSSTFISPGIATIIWSNGNPITITHGTGPTSTLETFDYYTDILSQPGDKWDTDQLIRGYKTIKPKNALLSEVSGGLPLVTFDYIFDAEGKIIKLNFGAGGSGYYDYLYQCN